MPSTTNSKYLVEYEAWYSGPGWLKETKILPGLTSKMVSSNHYPIDTSTDDGGIFILQKDEHKYSPGYNPGTTIRGKRGYFVTNLYPTAFGQQLASPTEIPDADLKSAGTTAIARCEPTSPAFEMSTAMGELISDGLPSGFGANLFASYADRAHIARSAGSEYLNAQFGWLPLMSDIRSFAYAVKESDRILSSYRKGSDTKIRQRYDFPSATDTTARIAGNYIPSGGCSAFGSGTTSERKLERTWFSGAFRYHIPSSDTQIGKFREWASMADHLLGVKVTPETLWNIAPWSWAADWFSNTGDVLHNVSALGRDGLVMQYGYIMNERTLNVTTTATFAVAGGSSTTSHTYTGKQCKRLGASPYGFDVSWDGMTAKQLAVTAALGLSRTSRPAG